MKIEWVNHASFILEHGSVRIICDPWLDGSVFDKGWSLLSKTKFKYSDFKDITHIWFSHEHPDHFSPPNLNKIDINYRKNITVLYQNTIDKKVVDYCVNAGFKKAIEMNPSSWINIDSDLDLLCEHHDTGDSWLAIKNKDLTILNINDCVIDNIVQCKEILKKVGKVDILLSQFSYANWVGNPDEKHKRLQEAREKLIWMKLQIEIFNPCFVIPFASFVWFSHKDNFFMNDGVNTIKTTYDFLKDNTDTKQLILYPGDVISLKDLDHLENHDNNSALSNYLHDYLDIKNRPLSTSERMDIDNLIQNGNKFVEKLMKNNGNIASFLPVSNIFVEDFEESLTMSSEGVKRASVDEVYCDISVKSDALNYCYLFDWGGSTLNINGRFTVPDKGNYQKFRTYMTLSNFNNREEGFSDIVKVVAKRFVDKLL